LNPSAPKNTPLPAGDAKAPPPFNMQIVGNIPVKNPNPSGNLAPPPTGVPAAKISTPSIANQDRPQDPMLRGVNQPAKQPEKSNQAQVDNPKQAVAKNNVVADRGSPPIIAVIVACLVALMLSAAAVSIYRGDF
jgi:hypothetical protein